MKAGVVIFPGSNCDYDAFHALRDVAGIPTEFIWHKDTRLDGYGLVVLPGGFSYGDYLRAGSIARFSPIMDALLDYAEKDKGLVLGICNGFQILTEAGLLPGALAKNITRRFICKTVELLVERNDTPFSSYYERGQIIRMPIAHSEGRYYLPEPELDALEAKGLVLFRYHGENPNGSLNSIAGIINERGNVLGMMPHPERNSERVLGDGSGLGIFLSLKKALGI
ncbi:MAG: phosphoribosylformylglycinamidine synthase subunit PurQ [candidate division WOR-3 bacterium]